MFATLDPTIRAVRLPSRRRVLLSDTVGFLRDLPPDLIAAFRATLEEVQEAAADPAGDRYFKPSPRGTGCGSVEGFAGLGSGGSAAPARLEQNRSAYATRNWKRFANSNGGRRANRFHFGGHRRKGLDDLLERIDAAMPVDPLMRLLLRMPVSDGRSLSLIQAGGRVLHSEIDDGHLLLDAEIPQSLARKLEKFAW